ncbi:MarR family winged helix-turn-helix transcriptional regulator [Polynucleobacter sp. MG-6-Vaara-E2]|uniref:MarR family winged helix-turn-helix transcriptional regulator n=1 Tax=Polynucleobacter sp. MG-6-Vaara-E2 TaxID=2576932 RepID=UPI001BFE65D4|nr:MarR family winged helix-turn-helix transcriptional regulator [Polynucleobacter sp. MG-6-Vaara-E2]QWD96231.1 MarR family transcriptional regulator [Polynucleobacter sp. MG-6-Vaara-E2]
MKAIKPTAYIRFINFLDSIDRINPGKKLDSTEEQLLNQVTLAATQGKELLVGDLISLSELGSQATLHGRIKNLVGMGYVKLNEDKADGRKKFVKPTAKALKHYERLSACLEEALRSS